MFDCINTAFGHQNAAGAAKTTGFSLNDPPKGGKETLLKGGGEI
ncbi:hypothetical protein [Caulobacter henricii]|nr:hypothetical protein [Caulobacter henricii]